MSDDQIKEAARQLGNDLRALAERMLVAIRDFDEATMGEVVTRRKELIERLQALAKVNPRAIQYCGTIAAAVLLEDAVVSALATRHAAIGAQLKELDAQADIRKVYAD